MKDLKVTFIQANLYWEDRDKNLAHFDHLIGRISEATDMVLLPEMFNTGFSINPAACAETMDGPSVLFLREKAREKNAVFMATLLITENGGHYNRLVCMFPDGRCETYDKRHLFRLSEEYRIFKAGKKRRVIEVNGWKILPVICYDLRFPVWTKNTWSEEGYEYDLLVCLSNWPASRSHVWKTLLQARAIENQACVAGVNRIGNDGHGTWHSGDSMALDPKGQIIYSAREATEEIGHAVFSAQDLSIFRESFTVGMDWDSFSLKVK
jgi:predicted amidohydrolase